MKFLSWFFMIIGIFTIINGLTIQVASNIHQIYAQLLNLTGFVMFYCGLILPKICKIADSKEEKEDKKNEENI